MLLIYLPGVRVVGHDDGLLGPLAVLPLRQAARLEGGPVVLGLGGGGGGGSLHGTLGAPEDIWKFQGCDMRFQLISANLNGF